MPPTRQQVCQSASSKLTAGLTRVPGLRAVVGWDGFVDEIIAVVDRRTDFEHYEAVPTIARLAEKIASAAGQSSNYELVTKRMKLGGNGPIMANALAHAGAAVTYIGTLGYPAVHPVFADLAKRAKVISIAEPGHTDALEFSDGKLMLGKLSSLADVNWTNLVQRVGGTAKFEQLLAAASLIGTVNWTMLPFMDEVWQHFHDEALPKLPPIPGGRILFVDLADPEKRTHSDLQACLKLLTALQKRINVILGLNLKESIEVLGVLGMPVASDAAAADPAAVQGIAQSLRQKLGLFCVVVHPRTGAAAATGEEAAWVAGPFVGQPKISTGAGDNFNAGFCLGHMLGLGLAESLCTGVGTSGYYVRNADSPTAADLAKFIATMPSPQQ